MARCACAAELRHSLRIRDAQRRSGHGQRPSISRDLCGHPHLWSCGRRRHHVSSDAAASFLPQDPFNVGNLDAVRGVLTIDCRRRFDTLNVSDHGTTVGDTDVHVCATNHGSRADGYHLRRDRRALRRRCERLGRRRRGYDLVDSTRLETSPRCMPGAADVITAAGDRRRHRWLRRRLRRRRNGYPRRDAHPHERPVVRRRRRARLRFLRAEPVDAGRRARSTSASAIVTHQYRRRGQDRPRRLGDEIINAGVDPLTARCCSDPLTVTRGAARAHHRRQRPDRLSRRQYRRLLTTTRRRRPRERRDHVERGKPVFAGWAATPSPAAPGNHVISVTTVCATRRHRDGVRADQKH